MIEAWRSCNFDTWERSPLPREVSSLGCSEGEESDSGPSHESWHQAIELQRELIKIAGWPDCRAVFEENLRDAQSRVAYAQELARVPSQQCENPAREASGASAKEAKGGATRRCPMLISRALSHPLIDGGSR